MAFDFGDLFEDELPGQSAVQPVQRTSGFDFGDLFEDKLATSLPPQPVQELAGDKPPISLSFTPPTTEKPEPILRAPSPAEQYKFTRPEIPIEDIQGPSREEFLQATPIIGGLLEKLNRSITQKGVKSREAQGELLMELLQFQVIGKALAPLVGAGRGVLRAIGERIARKFGSEKLAQAFGTSLEKQMANLTDKQLLDLFQKTPKAFQKEMAVNNSRLKQLLLKERMKPDPTTAEAFAARQQPLPPESKAKFTVNDITPVEKAQEPILLSTQQTFKNVTDEAVNSITLGAGLKPQTGIERAIENTNKGFVTKLVTQSQKFLDMHIRPERFLRAMDNWKDDGPMVRTVMNPLLEAETQELTGLDVADKKLKEIHKAIKWTEVTTTKYDVGRFKDITKDIMMDIYANSFNQNNLKDLRASGITDKDITDIKSFLSVEEKTAIDNTIKYLTTEQYPAINKIFSEIKGRDLGFQESYFPLSKLDFPDGLDGIEMEIDARAAFDPDATSSTSRGLLKKRTPAQLSFSDFSYIKKLFKYINDAEHYKAYSKPIRDSSMFLSDPKIKKSIAQNYGNNVNQIFDKWLKDIGMGTDTKDIGTAGAISKWIRSNSMIAFLGYNMNTVLKQPASFSQGVAKIGETQGILSTLKFLKNPLKKIREVDAKSIVQKHRGFSFDRDLQKMFNSPQAGKLFKEQGITPQIKKELFRFIRGADKITTTIIWDGAFNGAISEGKSEQEAVKWANRIVRETQPAGQVMNLPDLFRAGPFAKAYTTFKNQLNQNLNLQYESTSKLKRAKGATKIRQSLSFSRDSIYNLIIPAAYLGIVTRRRLPKAKEMIRDSMHQITGSLFLLSGLTTEWDSPMSIIESFGKEITKGGQAFFKGDFNKATSQAVRTLAIALGIPIAAASRLVQGRFFGGTKQKKPTRGRGRKDTQSFTLKDVAQGIFRTQDKQERGR